jgi:hypothetical protein
MVSFSVSFAFSRISPDRELFFSSAEILVAGNAPARR